jgi:hemerythrin-like metal-binding protein
MTIFWSDQLYTGHKTIDREHLNLCLILSVLGPEVKSARHADSINADLDFLVQTTEKHLENEADILRETGALPALIEEHQKEHQNLVRELQAVVQKLNSTISENRKGDYYREIFDRLDGWFTEHISRNAGKINPKKSRQPPTESPRPPL